MAFQEDTAGESDGEVNPQLPEVGPDKVYVVTEVRKVYSGQSISASITLTAVG